jgi:Mu transposase, C-terminal domain
VIDIREILRRLHLGEPDRRIARDLGVSRNTVAHYRVWATRHGVLERNALAGRVFRDVHDGNRHLLRWCVETAGRRIHGTTKRAPLEVFETLERAALRPLPLTPWELVEWKRAKLHADCHVVFAGAYYSAPPPLARRAPLGPGHSQQGRALSRLRPCRDPSPRPSRSAPHADGSPATRQSPLPSATGPR